MYFRMKKILRKFHANVEEILGDFGKILTKLEKSWRNFEKFENSLRSQKFVKCSGKFQKILKILRDSFKKILMKSNAKFEECRWWKKIDNF